ncbi:MAG: glycosyltransferase family 2 protein [Verrucomicrobiota bacterium JB022]|nr:glycosyltransferase family 2 protein [Verrucomicrobiota bacterium JB022]
MNDPLVSIIVLSFNRKEEILDCLASLEQQTYARTETIVLDNGSKDGSAEAVAERFPHVRLIRMPHNFGAWGPRDMAIWNSTGDYIFMIDSDAVAPADALEKLVAKMEAERSIGILQPMIKDLHSETVYSMGFGREEAKEPCFRWQFHGCAALIRREAYFKAGGFPHHYLVAGGEAYLAIPVLDAGYDVYYWPEVHVRHALSPKERVKSHRLLMSNLHRMQNNATYNPYLGRVWLDFAWKLVRYAKDATANGYFKELLPGLALHVKEFFHTLRHLRRPIAPQTQNLIDYLMVHRVTERAEYERINRERSYFAGRRRYALRTT